MEQDSGVFIRRLVTDVSDAMIASDSNMIIREWNPAAEKLYGYTAVEARGKRLVDLVNRRYLSTTREDVLDAFHESGSWHGEVVDTTRDGRQIRIMTRVSKIHSHDNQYIGTVAVNRDITRQRLLEQRQQCHSQIYRLLAEATAICKTQQELCQFIVDRLASILKVHSVILQFIAQETHEKCTCSSSGSNTNLTKGLLTDSNILSHLFKQCERITVNDLNSTENNEVWIEVLKEYKIRGFIAVPICDHNRLPVGAIYLVSQDPFHPCDCDHCHLENFSNMMASAMHRVVSEERSSQTSKRLQTIFEHIIDVYFRISPDGVLETISPSGLAVFKVAAEEEIIGRNIRGWMFGNNAICDTFLDDVISAGSVTGYDLLVKDAANNHLDMEVNARLARSGDGTPLYIEGLMRDLTRRKQMEEELRQKAKLENMGFLVGSVAHAFNNNLTGVLGSISVAQHYAADNEKLKNFLAKAETGCLTAKQTVQQLMLISGSIKPICRPLHLEPLIQGVIETQSRSCQTKIDVHVQDKIPRVPGNYKQLEQVFSHVLANSIEALEGQGQVTILIGLRDGDAMGSDPISLPAAEPMATVTITDNGPGISPDVLRRVFEPFFTTRESSRGLGLSVSRSIVRRHDGSVYITSTEGGGTSVKICLPLYEDDINQKNTSNRLRVLVMDPNQIVRQVFVDIMKELGHFAVGVETDQDCLREFRQSLNNNESYNIIFIDVGTVDSSSGSAVLKMIHRVNPDIYAIATSGYADHPVMIKYDSYGFKGVLQKPFRLNAVEKTLEKLSEQLLNR